MSQAETIIEQLINSSTSLIGQPLDEQTKLNLIWKRLPLGLRSRVDQKRLGLFLSSMEGGAKLFNAARSAKLTTALAVDIMYAIEQAGLI